MSTGSQDHNSGGKHTLSDAARAAGLRGPEQAKTSGKDIYKTWIRRLCFGLVMMSAGIAMTLVFPDLFRTRETRESQLPGDAAPGYYPLGQAMAACGYKPDETAAFSFIKNVSGKPVRVEYDFAANQCRKNSYTFDMTGRWVERQGEQYLHGPLLENITNHTLIAGGNQRLIALPIHFAPHEWTTAFPPLVAHAGGILRKTDKNLAYTNSLEAIVQNYDLGHRVFEIDFQVTSDRNLAAVHEGMAPGDKKGISMTGDEWLAHSQYVQFTTLLIGDILDQMLVNTDMFLITDTKGDDTAAFGIIREEAAKRDSALLDRIIPQIYNRAMYDKLMGIHAFPSVIFTTYATRETPEEIVAFAASKSNIRVITTPGIKGTVNPALLRLTARENLLLYGHTMNEYNDITQFRKKGVHGLYTDYLTPNDFETYAKLSGQRQKSRTAGAPGLQTTVKE